MDSDFTHLLARLAAIAVEGGPVGRESGAPNSRVRLRRLGEIAAMKSIFDSLLAGIRRRLATLEVPNCREFPLCACKEEIWFVEYQLFSDMVTRGIDGHRAVVYLRRAVELIGAPEEISRLLPFTRRLSLFSGNLFDLLDPTRKAGAHEGFWVFELASALMAVVNMRADAAKVSSLLGNMAASTEASKVRIGTDDADVYARLRGRASEIRNGDFILATALVKSAAFLSTLR